MNYRITSHLDETYNKVHHRNGFCMTCILCNPMIKTTWGRILLQDTVFWCMTQRKWNMSIYCPSALAIQILLWMNRYFICIVSSDNVQLNHINNNTKVDGYNAGKIPEAKGWKLGALWRLQTAFWRHISEHQIGNKNHRFYNKYQQNCVINVLNMTCKA